MAASDDPRVKFGLSCPAGGGFHICQDSPTRFIGCCGVDPCTPDREGECPMSELFVASFSAASGVEFLPQSCASPFNSSIWYTCDDTRPPFLGCCTNNPCSNGCLADHLVPAKLSDDPKNASQFLLPETVTMTTTTTTTTTTSPSVTGTSVLPAGTENSSPNLTTGGRARAGLIAGIAVAGVVILLLVIAAYLWAKRREEAQEKCEQDQEFKGGRSADAVQSNGVFQGKERSSKSDSCYEDEVASPVEESAFPSPKADRFPRDPRNNIPSPSASKNFHNPHDSQLSELEGGSGLIRALHPNLGNSYRGFDGREL